MKIIKLFSFISIVLLSSCTSYLLPSPDKLNRDLVVPLGKYDGDRRYYPMNPVDVDARNYERSEYFEGNFRGVEVELLVNWEKQGNDLVMVASATAGQPVFAIKQRGRQLAEQHDYVETKGLRYSWLLADYQLIHLSSDLLEQQLQAKSVQLLEIEHHHQNPVVDQVLGLVLVKSRYLLPQSAAQDLGQAVMKVDYFARLSDVSEGSAFHQYQKIVVENSRWKYRYVITLLDYSEL